VFEIVFLNCKNKLFNAFGSEEAKSVNLCLLRNRKCDEKSSFHSDVHSIKSFHDAM